MHILSLEFDQQQRKFMSIHYPMLSEENDVTELHLQYNHSIIEENK